MSNRAVFDQLSTILLSMPVKSQFGGAPVYYHPDGKTRCIIGRIMPDGVYEPGMDERGVDIPQMQEEFPRAKEWIASLNCDPVILEGFQSIHDDGVWANGEIVNGQESIDKLEQRLIGDGFLDVSVKTAPEAPAAA